MIFSTFKWNDSTVLELKDAIRGYVYYRQTRLNLITGYPEVYSFNEFLDSLEKLQLQDRVSHPRVYHFYYELGFILQGQGHNVDNDTPLAVEIEYTKSSKKKMRKPRLDKMPLKSLERPTWSEYKEAFMQIQDLLLAGDCYQVNLTYPFDFETEEMLDSRDIIDFFFSRPGLGAYAHATYFGEELILSNSPECLFQYKKNEVFTMPIKGTIKRKESFKKDWVSLMASSKDEAELLIITDLLKNDLNKLERPIAKVHKLRAPLKVPGLLHQYSLLSVKLKEKISVLKTLECLFPGGSITGAPKKRVMQIIGNTERFDRGLYCGSTLLCYEDKKAASINIRTASVVPGDKLWRYGAGGGITLLSNPVHEFQEMEAKVASFLTLLNTPGYTTKK